ncbi:unnamed protein product [Kluyveromyces dobzhanskii CBS 2104]|uniref:WGS project CCBQ000000000 data, contig 00098 n=1 Tax=Kluyveromyces dobzhanskii CBS 2104 TaxID=1427455 RepID=A0A0A8L3K6_9SACH|nr:unnamed protein product [Kluyveromyces dobzhanskii CBS 2104]
MTVAKHVVKITDALFSSSLRKGASYVFPNKISFEIRQGEKWCIWGPAKEKFIDAVSNKYLSEPPLAVTYGNVSKERLPRIERIKFKGVMPTAHLSARYEFFKDEFDQTCEKFILDNSIGSRAVDYEVQTTNRYVDLDLLEHLLKELKLTDIRDRWAMGLSNGQMRRARLARSFLKKPDLAIIDDPFLGLDPTATSILSQFLSKYDKDTSIIIGLRYQDQIPDWCTHVVCVDQDGVEFQGSLEQYRDQVESMRLQLLEALQLNKPTSKYTIEDLVSPHKFYRNSHHDITKIPSVVALKGLNVTYSGVPVLKDVYWDVKQGSKWHIQGDNGSGKSTLLSLITADHPQSWNSKFVDHGVPRRTGNTNFFDINKRIGLSSPEMHALFLKKAGDLSVLETVASGFHEVSSNNFLRAFDTLTDEQKKIIEMYIDYFHLDPEKSFNALSISDQKIVLFVRAAVKLPEIMILDEAFSGTQTEQLLRAHQFLEQWPGTVFVVSHVAEETPKCNHFLRLLKPGEYEIGDVD